MFSILILHSLFFTPCAPCWEWTPEFQSLTETEQSEFEGPWRFNSEYASDVLSYRKPADWEYLWLSQDKGLDMTIGSVSSSHFLIDNRLKIHTFLNEYLQFRFTHTDERNRERESTHSVIELVFWPIEKIGLSIYGEPSLYKRDNDTGLAFLWRPEKNFELRFFNTFVDVTRLKRNDRNDNFIEPYLPYSRGVVGRFWEQAEESSKEHPFLNGEFFEFAMRFDTQTRWSFPDQHYQYEYWKALGSFFGSKKITQSLSVNLRLQWDRKFESKLDAGGPSLVGTSNIRTDRFFIVARTEVSNLGPKQNLKLTPGFEIANRSWDTPLGTVIYRDLLPHVLFEFPAFGSEKSQDHVRLGYVVTWHRAFGPISLRDPQDADKRLEQKLDISYEFNFGQKAKLALMATGDIDQFFSRKSWDGGSGQFQLFF